MRDIREIAEKIGEAKVKYEQANENTLNGKNEVGIASYWGERMSTLQWVLGDEWISYPVVTPKKEG